MRLGLLQQVGSPKELYDTPNNLFVAGFIGSPAMNFMSGTVEDGTLRTSLGDFPITGRLRRELEGSRTGRNLIVGIRPENFEDVALVSPDVRGSGITFHADIDVVESMGSDVYVYFSQEREQGVNAAELEELARDSGRADTGGGDTVVARLAPDTRIREGQDAEIWVDARAIHVFDPESGRNLSRGAEDATSVSGAPPARADAGAAPPDQADEAQADEAQADKARAGSASPDAAEPASSAAVSSQAPADGQASSSPAPPSGQPGPGPASPGDSAASGEAM